MRQKLDLPGQFELNTVFTPTGDQPEAIEKLVEGIEDGEKFQTLLGVTGSGKTFTMANVIQKVQKPTLVIAPNKTLAGQLCEEFRAFFPNNRVEYFVSYYDYYQPEAYIPSTDTFIEKDSAINDEIDRLRHAATSSLLERRDVIVVASVSCIYGLGDPEDYQHMMVHLRPGQLKDRDDVIAELVNIQYMRNDFELKRGHFRVRGDTLDIWPANAESTLMRISFFGDEIERILEMDRLSGKVLASRSYVSVFPASHYATTDTKMQRAIDLIEAELEERLEVFRQEGKIVEAYRLEQRTRYDLEMLRETGFTKGIENYSRHLAGRAEGEAPFTLFDFFPEDYLLMIDESHITVPQIGAMYNGDHSRKVSLVDFGFRLPSAFDNRPLQFTEFEERLRQVVFVSATPSTYEREHATNIVEQIIRPTGLVDPTIEIHPVEGQIEDILAKAKDVISRDERVLILTLTKKMAEDLTDFLAAEGLKVQYLHSTIETAERLKILRDLRHGHFDILVGINLLREGLDLPEVSLICILDADRQGFLRSTRSLIQIIGRAARNVNGKVVMYADEVTEAMMTSIAETNRRRAIQVAYNEEHNITPTTIRKDIRDTIDTFEDIVEEEGLQGAKASDKKDESIEDRIRRMPIGELQQLITRMEKEMRAAAKQLEFEEAARLRDLVIFAKGRLLG